MKCNRRKITLRAKRMDRWRMIHPERMPRKIKWRGPPFVPFNFYPPGISIFDHVSPIHTDDGKSYREHIKKEFETLERQLFGRRVAVFNKLARS